MSPTREPDPTEPPRRTRTGPRDRGEVGGVAEAGRRDVSTQVEGRRGGGAQKSEQSARGIDAPAGFPHRLSGSTDGGESEVKSDGDEDEGSCDADTGAGGAEASEPRGSGGQRSERRSLGAAALNIAQGSGGQILECRSPDAAAQGIVEGAGGGGVGGPSSAASTPQPRKSQRARLAGGPSFVAPTPQHTRSGEHAPGAQGLNIYLEATDDWMAGVVSSEDTQHDSQGESEEQRIELMGLDLAEWVASTPWPAVRECEVRDHTRPRRHRLGDIGSTTLKRGGSLH